MADEIAKTSGEPEERKDPLFEAIETLASGAKSWEGAAFFGLLVYVATMAYEFGFLSYFHAPFELATFTTENAFRTAIVLILAGFASSLSIGVIRDNWKRRVVRSVLIAFALGALLLIVKFMPLLQAVVSAMGLFFVAVATKYLLFPRSSGRAMTWAARIKSHMGLAMLTLLIALPYFATTTGFIAAACTKEFLKLDESPPLVVIRVYGSTALCAEFKEDWKETRLQPGFRLVNLADPSTPKVLRVEFKNLLPADK